MTARRFINGGIADGLYEFCSATQPARYAARGQSNDGPIPQHCDIYKYVRTETTDEGDVWVYEFHISKKTKDAFDFIRRNIDPV